MNAAYHHRGRASVPGCEHAGAQALDDGPVRSFVGDEHGLRIRNLVLLPALATVEPRSLAPLGVGFGLAHGALFPALMALLFVDAEPAGRARLAGLANGVMNLGMLSVLGFGQLAKHLGLSAVFVSK